METNPRGFGRSDLWEEMKELNTVRQNTCTSCALHPGAVPRSSCGDSGMKLQARRLPAESMSPQADKQVALRVFNFLHHRAAMCLSYRESLNTLGSNSDVFYGHREITESSQGTLCGRESSVFVVHPALTGVCASASHPLLIPEELDYSRCFPVASL